MKINYLSFDSHPLPHPLWLAALHSLTWLIKPHKYSTMYIYLVSHDLRTFYCKTLFRKSNLKIRLLKDCTEKRSEHFLITRKLLCSSLTMVSSRLPWVWPTHSYPPCVRPRTSVNWRLWRDHCSELAPVFRSRCPEHWSLSGTPGSGLPLCSIPLFCRLL